MAQPADSVAAGPLPSGSRGAIHIADRVVAKIASYAAREALREFAEAGLSTAAARPTAQATASVRRSPEPAEGVSAGVHGEARVRVVVELRYPSDIGAQCRAVRREVADRVCTLAGMEVPEIIVSVERLHSVHSRGAGQERVI